MNEMFKKQLQGELVLNPTTAGVMLNRYNTLEPEDRKFFDEVILDMMDPVSNCPAMDTQNKNKKKRPREELTKAQRKILFFQRLNSEVQRINNSNGQVQRHKLQAMPKIPNKVDTPDQFRNIYQTLATAEKTTSKIDKLIHYNQGMLFHVTQDTLPEARSKEFWKLIDLSYNHVHNHIKFYLLVEMCPVLLSTDISYSEIMMYIGDIRSKLGTDTVFAQSMRQSSVTMVFEFENFDVEGEDPDVEIELDALDSHSDDETCNSDDETTDADTRSRTSSMDNFIEDDDQSTTSAQSNGTEQASSGTEPEASSSEPPSSGTEPPSSGTEPEASSSEPPSRSARNDSASRSSRDDSTSRSSRHESRSQRKERRDARASDKSKSNSTSEPDRQRRRIAESPSSRHKIPSKRVSLSPHPHIISSDTDQRSAPIRTRSASASASPRKTLKVSRIRKAHSNTTLSPGNRAAEDPQPSILASVLSEVSNMFQRASTPHQSRHAAK